MGLSLKATKSFLIDWMTLISGLEVLGAIFIFILPSQTVRWSGEFQLFWKGNYGWSDDFLSCYGVVNL